MEDYKTVPGESERFAGYTFHFVFQLNFKNRLPGQMKKVELFHFI